VLLEQLLDDPVLRDVRDVCAAVVEPAQHVDLARMSTCAGRERASARTTFARGKPSASNWSTCACASPAIATSSCGLPVCGEPASGPPAYICVQYLAVSSKPARLARKCFATSASCGSRGSGLQSSDWSESSVLLSVSTGVHASLRMSRQIAPDADDTFGW
jgi:hypothetical protein